MMPLNFKGKYQESIWALRDSVSHPEDFGSLGLATIDLAPIDAIGPAAPADFIVEEIPAYHPCGEGEHLFLWIQKIAISSDELLSKVMSKLNISEREIGIAGLKDKNAISTQFISVPRKLECHLKEIEGDGITILDVHAHRNKLRMGHLRGNRFRVVLRPRSIGLNGHCDLSQGSNPHFTPDDFQACNLITSRLQKGGIPNFFGWQRFGQKRDTAQIGLRLIKGENGQLHKRWKRGRRRTFALSAAQSAVFNRYLFDRIAELGFNTIALGDIMYKWQGKGRFLADDIDALEPRLSQREIVSSGPIFGSDPFRPTGKPLELERNALAFFGLTFDGFSNLKRDLPGSRRPNFAYLDEFDVSLSNISIELKFSLPPGSYASVVISEYLKPCSRQPSF